MFLPLFKDHGRLCFSSSSYADINHPNIIILLLKYSISDIEKPEGRMTFHQNKILHTLSKCFSP